MPINPSKLKTRGKLLSERRQRRVLFYSRFALDRFEQFAAQRRIVGSPVAIGVGIFIDDLSNALDLGIQVIQKMQRDRFKRHGQFRAAIFVLAVMADNHVLQTQMKFFWKRLAR